MTRKYFILFLLISLAFLEFLTKIQENGLIDTKMLTRRAKINELKKKLRQKGYCSQKYKIQLKVRLLTIEAYFEYLQKKVK